MTKRSLIACVCIFFCIAMLSLGCKKGCTDCKAYGLSSGANNTYQGYTAQVCINNFCTCQNGFEGDSCQIYSVNKYFMPSPNWIAYDCTGAQYPVSMQGSTSYPYTVFYINGLFNNYGTLVAANISSTGGNQSTIVIQPVSLPTGSINSPCLASYQLIGGLGKLTLNLDYTPYSTNAEQNCTVTIYQQL